MTENNLHTNEPKVQDNTETTNLSNGTAAEVTASEESVQTPESAVAAEPLTPPAEIVAETTVEIVAETTPEIVAETTPEIVAEIVAETAAEIVAETTAEIAAETTAENSSTQMIQEMEALDKLQALPGGSHEEIVPEEELSSEEIQRLGQLSREEMVENLQLIWDQQLWNTAKQTLAHLKILFPQKNQEHIQTLEKAFRTEHEEESYVHSPDRIEERFHELMKKIRDEKQKIKAEEERLKQENLLRKQAILEELRCLIESEDSLKTTYDELKKLQETWKEIGQVPKGEINNLWQSYHFLVEKFFDKIKINKDLRDLDLKKNLEMKMELCEKAEELLLETSFSKAFKLLQEYHDSWKEIGPVPSDKKEELWERFKTTSDAINQKRRQYYDEMQAVQEQNFLAKSALCEKIEELLQRPLESIKQWNASGDEINEWMTLWKQIGRASANKNEEVWERFKTGLNSYYDKKRVFFNTLKEEQLNNLNLKINLCVQAEAIALRDDFRKATDEMLALQEEWKKTGPVSKKHADKIWKRFRTACDQFFNKKNAALSESRSQEKENLKLKEALIAEVLATDLEADKSTHLASIKDYQKRWTHIGHVPIREKDKLYEAFRSAIQTLMEKLKIHPGELHASAFAGKYSNIQNPEDAQGLSGREISQLQSKINKLRDDVLLWENNLGFFSKSKNADVLRNEVEGKIHRAKQELALLEAKMKIIRQR